MGDRQTDGPPRRAGIKAQKLREDIIHLRYKEIVHLGYALRPASALQSDHLQAGRPLNLFPFPSTERPGFSLACSRISAPAPRMPLAGELV